MKRIIAAFALLLICVSASAITVRSTSEDGLTGAVANHELRMQAQEALLWEDLRFPSTGINLQGAPAAATPNTISILVRRLGGSDAHNDIISLLEFDIHYLSENRGSTAETGDH